MHAVNASKEHIRSGNYHARVSIPVYRLFSHAFYEAVLVTVAAPLNI